MEREIIILNELVKILLTKTECGINVLIAGGDFAHIGAVSIVDLQGEIFTKTFEGHKDYFVSEEWAEKLNKLIRDESLRNQIASSAHARIMKEYMTDDMEMETLRAILK